MKTKITFLVVFIITSSFVLQVKAQQISSGMATEVDNFNAILPSGMYYTNNAQSGYPCEVPAWPRKHMIASNTEGSCQLQISSPFTHDDRMFFRKVVKDHNNPNCISEWYEVATRGHNKYTDHQHISMGKSLVFGKDGYLDQFRLTYIGDTNRGDAYIDYSHELFFRNENTGSSVPLIHFTNQGNVAIGKLGASDKLEVNGTIRAKEVKIEATGWADFVFAEEYNLPSLTEVKKHIDEKKHLPGIPSEEEVKENGINMGEMQAKLLQKIEELTLYVIEQQKTIDELSKEVRELKTKSE